MCKLETGSLTRELYLEGCRLSCDVPMDCPFDNQKQFADLYESWVSGKVVDCLSGLLCVFYMFTLGNDAHVLYHLSADLLINR